MLKIKVLHELYKEPSKKFCSELNVELVEDNSADIVWGNLNYSDFKNYPNLKWVQTLTSGVDSYISNDIGNVILTCASGAYSLAISEYILTVHLNLLKNLNLYRNNQKDKVWRPLGGNKFIHSSKVVIWGMGAIGSSYAKIAKSLGSYVIGVTREKMNCVDYCDELYTSNEVDKFINDADCIVVAMPKTNETFNLINKEIFNKMKSSSIIINVGRGEIINTKDLEDALINKVIFGAALDVCNPEPLDKDSLLWEMENVIITPHISGDFNSKETIKENCKLFKENINLYLNNSQLINEVDFSTGYRKKLNKRP